MHSISHRRAPVLWDASTMCLGCFLKQSRRYSSAALRSPSRARSLSPEVDRCVTSTQDSRRGCGPPSLQRKPRRSPGFAPSLPSGRTFVTSSASSQLDNFIRRGSFGQPQIPLRPNRTREVKHTEGSGSDIRALLKQWQPQTPAVTMPAEGIWDMGMRGGVVNNLTRPESVDPASYDNSMMDEEAQSYIRDFDRITETSATTNHLGSMLRRGDLVELRGNMNTPLFAVYLGISQNKYFQFYTIAGRLYSASYRTSQFQVDGYYDPSELDAITPFIPAVTEEADMDITIPRNISGPILSKLVKFREGCEAMYRKYTTGIDSVYDRLAHPRELRHVLLEDVVSEITGQPVDEHKPFPPELLFAISNALLRDRFGFLSETRSYAWTRVLCVQPKENAVTVERVQKWLRAFHEDAALIAGGFEVPRNVAKDATIVKSFVHKCKQLVSESRSLRQYSPEGIVVGCGTKSLASSNPKLQDMVHSLEFSDSDREFIRVLKLHTMGESLFRHPTYRSLSSSIVRAVGVYNEDELREDICWNFLVELGVVEPYTQALGFDSECRPPNQQLTNELAKIDSRMAEGRTGTDATGLKDSMQHLRRDWGDLPVYCIDSEGTKEVDDGISMERIPEEPDNVWLRFHISHISAFTTPNDTLGKCATHHLTSMYMTDGKVPMLPEWAGREFSLGSNRPCLTYSAKLNQAGEMLEYTVEPGMLRNVLYMTPAMVNECVDKTILKEADKPPYFTLSCGQSPNEDENEPARPLTTPSGEHRATLGKLLELCRKMKDRRTLTMIGNIFSQDLLEASVTKLPGESRMTTTANPSHARYNLEDPCVELKVNHDVDSSSPDNTIIVGRARDNADMMVEQCMLLANVIAGKWANDRNIPVIYTGTRPAVEGLEDITAQIRKDVLEGTWDNNYVTSTVLNLYAVRVYTTFPVEQKIMGTPEYAKVTSPLRRLFDLVSSWQIDATLRHEHSTGASLSGRSAASDHESFLPYQRKEIENNLRIWAGRLQDIGWYQRGNTAHWVVQAIARAFYLGQAPLPSPLTCEIGKVRIAKAMGRIRELEFNVTVQTVEGPDGEMVQEGDVWEVEIAQVLIWARQVVVRLVKKLPKGSRLGTLPVAEGIAAAPAATT